MVVGGFAVNFHGYSRSTMDMDIWVDTNEKNLKRLFNSFKSLGFEKSKCSDAIQYLVDNHMIKIPLDKTKIELLDSFMIKYEFETSYRNHIKTNVGGVEIKIIGFDDLIGCKKKSNRMKDLLDVENLEALKELSKNKLKKDQGLTG
ncbi:hypothetical protein ES705_05157 [subsurface metagenome]